MKKYNIWERGLYNKWYRKQGVTYTAWEKLLLFADSIIVLVFCIIAWEMTATHRIDQLGVALCAIFSMFGLIGLFMIDNRAVKRKVEELNKKLEVK